MARKRFKQLDLTGTTQQLEIFSASGRMMPQQLKPSAFAKQADKLQAELFEQLAAVENSDDDS